MNLHDAMTEAEYRRRLYLPRQIEATRHKLAMLENEARRYGMTELLKEPYHANLEWDKTVKRAQYGAASNGGSIGFGEAVR